MTCMSSQAQEVSSSWLLLENYRLMAGPKKELYGTGDKLDDNLPSRALAIAINERGKGEKESGPASPSRQEETSLLLR